MREKLLKSIIEKVCQVIFDVNNLQAVLLSFDYFHVSAPWKILDHTKYVFSLIISQTNC